MKKFYLIVVVLVVAALAGLWYLGSDKAKARQESIAAITNLQNNDYIYSKNNSKVTLIEYLDFQCPACKNVYPMVSTIKEEYKYKIQFVVRYFPLSIHSLSKYSARAAEAAGRQGKFWEMYDKLFIGQSEWSNPDFEKIFQQYATEIGLDIDQFNKDYNDPTTLDRINKDENDGITIGVNATPTFILDGTKINNPGNIDSFRTILDDEIAKVNGK